MTFTPIYRGTLAQLEAEKMKAFDWLAAIIRDQIKFDDKAHGKVIKSLLERSRANLEVLKKLTNGFSLVVRRDRSGDRFSFVVNDAPKTDYYYAFEVGRKVNGRYGSQKILVRKDGTVHVQNLKLALMMWANRHISENATAKTLDKNRLLYETAGEPFKGFATDQDVSVELSKTHNNQALVCVTGPNSFVVKMYCKIEEIKSLVKVTREHRDALADFAKSVRD